MRNTLRKNERGIKQKRINEIKKKERGIKQK